MLFETGNIAESLPSLRTAVLLAPGQPLIQTLYATALMETGNTEDTNLAIEMLEESVRFDKRDSNSWRKLAIGYGKIGDMPNLSLASAEYSILVGKYKKARFHAQRALKLFPAGSIGSIRCRDILQVVEQRTKN
jgi:predicted Zn-dependent protease